MINAIIYLKKEHKPKDLVVFLLREKLIASASIDENNVSFKLKDGELVEEVYSVVTAQTKSLLFSALVKAVEEQTGKETFINSTPIVTLNNVFDDLIRTKTIPI